jgi:very-short-patch-repair endonuclease
MSATRHSHRSALLAGRAAVHRGALTVSEARLWASLRGSRLGVGFRRQFVVGRYIADFCVPVLRLVVEVDGGYHAERGGADGRRDRDMRRLGYRVVRVPHEAVMQRHDAVLRLIRVAVLVQRRALAAR